MPSTQAQSISDDLLSLPLGSIAKSFLDYLKVEAGLAEKVDVGNVDRADEGFVFSATILDTYLKIFG